MDDLIDPSDFCILLELDRSLTLRLEVLVDEVFISLFELLSDLSFTNLVRRGLRGVSFDEFGKSSDELALDCCILSLLQTRCTLLVSLPLARRRIEDFVDEAVDSCPLTGVFFVKLDGAEGVFEDVA